MATYHIKASDSVFGTGIAFEHTGPATVTLDSDAFLVATAGSSIVLDGSDWNATVNGEVLGGGGYGIVFNAVPGHSKVTVGSDGDVFGAIDALYTGQITDIVNNGRLFGGTAAIADAANGNYKITNSGEIEFVGAGDDPSTQEGTGIGIYLIGNGIHTIVNTGKILTDGLAIYSIGESSEHVINSGTISGSGSGPTYAGILLGPGADTFTNKGGLVNTGLDTGDGNDIVKVKAGQIASVYLGDGNDTYLGGTSGDTVTDGGGSDHVKLGGGDDVYFAIEITGGPDGTDAVDGGKGSQDEYVAGNAASEVRINLDKVAHTDLDLVATLAAQRAVGSEIGTDKITGFEVIFAGDGSDIVYGSAHSESIDGKGGNDHLFGLGGNDALTGDSGTDRLEGGDGDDTLYGGADGDLLLGGKGNDSLHGDSETDFLIGGAGRDILVGGTGGDVFRFLSLGDSGVAAAARDVIDDFNPSQGDHIELTAISLAIGTTLHLTTNDGHDSFSGDVGEVRTIYTAGGATVFVDSDGDGKANMAITVLIATGTHDLLAGDFFF